MMTRRQWLWIVLVAAAAGAALWWALRAQPVRVEIATVARGAFEQTVDEDGKTRVRDRYVVSAPIAGTVSRIALRAGDEVTRGMAVASIRPAPSPFIDARTRGELTERVGAAEAAKLRAQARVERAQVVVAQTQLDADRARRLAASGFVSPQARERAELELASARKELDASRYELHAAEHDLATARAAVARIHETRNGRDWTVTAPVAGSVLRVTQESEAVVTVGAPLLEIGNPDELEIVADVLTTEAVNVRPGAPVRIEGWGKGEPLSGRVRRVEPGAFTKVSALGVEEQRTNVVIDIVTPRSRWEALGDGYKIDARIVVHRQDDVLKVPTAALFRDGDAWAVFVVADGRAHLRRVEIGRRGAREATVEKGLEADGRVVVYPGDAVRDGRRVQPLR